MSLETVWQGPVVKVRENTIAGPLKIAGERSQAGNHQSSWAPNLYFNHWQGPAYLSTFCKLQPHKGYIYMQNRNFQYPFHLQPQSRGIA